MPSEEESTTRAFYSQHVRREWDRLVRDPFHRLEYDTTLRFLGKHLPSGGLILDAGGGPGRYTIELARQGYDVVLLDLVPESLEFARSKVAAQGLQDRIRGIVEGSIADLSRFEDESFDAVLCLGGPLSHVYPEVERAVAVSELVRVARVNAPIAVSVMGKFGVLLATPDGWPQEAGDKENLRSLVLDGDDRKWCGEGYCHFFTLRELEDLLLSTNVEVVERVGLEGLNASAEISNEFARRHPEAWRNWVEIHDELCTHPTVVDTSGHMMMVVKKL